MRDLVATILVTACTLLLGTCSAPDFPSGVIECGPGGACPDGFSCGSDDRCYDDSPDPSDNPGNAPDGTILAFDRPGCPNGWRRFSDAEGRMIVGTPSGGTAGGAAGGRLGDQAIVTISAVPQHGHTATTTATLDTDTHVHTLDSSTSHDADGAGETRVQEVSTSNGTAASGPAGFDDEHSHTVSIPSFTSASAGIPAVDVTMPYLQMVYCRREASGE